MSDVKIKIKDLTKYYGSTKGIQDLTLEIQSGEIFGFLGPNGAGKSTTIRCMMNILLPTRGEIWINGGLVSRNNPGLRKNIGYIPETSGLPTNYTVTEFLDYIEGMRGIPSLRRKELIKRFKLPVKKKIGELSKGNKQKVSIIAAFMHDPEVLILDEPTSGLDPLLQEECYDLLLEAKSRGRTIFYSSHNLAEVQQICDRVGIIKDGDLITIEKIENLNGKVPRVLEARLRKPDEAKLQSLGESLLETREDYVRILIRAQDSIQDFLKILIPMEPEELSFPPGSLREYFMQFYEKQEEGEI